MESSSQTRSWVANRLLYTAPTQRTDILDPNKTQTELIAALHYMLVKGYDIQVTALRSDHHDDSDIGTPPRYLGTHAHGWGIDFWFLNSPTLRNYMQQDTHEFRQALRDLTNAPFYKQTGLGGCANTLGDEVAAGAEWFPDDDEDHIHLGVTA